ncbi:hypothetical protein Fot_28552 [Forsythia ovata]|uniref:Retrotransposon gag domain-containing protein n=1 Tax=Forsythia ovata TaxID=205694 RepID=A0ABD1TPD0_9LAMI
MQEKDKSLKNYLARFTEEMHNCKSITKVLMFSTLKGGLDMCSMLWRDVQSRKHHDYNALVDLMKKEIISDEMARARDSHAQQRYNYGRQANTKPSDRTAHHQAEHRQRGYPHPFLGTGSNYATEITEAIPNLHAGLNAHN